MVELKTKEERIEEFITDYDEQWTITSTIAEKFNLDKSLYEYTEFCPDGSFEIIGINNYSEDTFVIWAKGEVRDNYLTNCGEGLMPCDMTYECYFDFFVTINGDKITVSFYQDETGAIDLDQTISWPDEYSDF